MPTKPPARKGKGRDDGGEFAESDGQDDTQQQDQAPRGPSAADRVRAYIASKGGRKPRA